ISGLKDATLKALIQKLDRQALHARTLGFLHPANGEYLEFSSPLPEDMAKILEQLEKAVFSS
ncbi:MAG: RluA family pseudouridine synthase, partial [Geobacteraceae bacterium]